MPIPSKRTGESRDEYLTRCMGNSTMVSEYPDASMRYAICVSKAKENVFKR